MPFTTGKSLTQLPTSGVTVTGTQTLSNKTIAFANNTITATKSQLNAAITNGVVLFVGDAVALSGAQTVAGVKSFSNEIICAAYVRTSSSNVGGLPSAATSGAGARAFVTNANATTFASIVSGGGANGVPVYSDGTDWRIG